MERIKINTITTEFNLDCRNGKNGKNVWNVITTQTQTTFNINVNIINNQSTTITLISHQTIPILTSINNIDISIKWKDGIRPTQLGSDNITIYNILKLNDSFIVLAQFTKYS